MIKKIRKVLTIFYLRRLCHLLIKFENCEASNDFPNYKNHYEINLHVKRIK